MSWIDDLLAPDRLMTIQQGGFDDPTKMFGTWGRAEVELRCENQRFLYGNFGTFNVEIEAKLDARQEWASPYDQGELRGRVGTGTVDMLWQHKPNGREQRCVASGTFDGYDLGIEIVKPRYFYNTPVVCTRTHRQGTIQRVDASTFVMELPRDVQIIPAAVLAPLLLELCDPKRER